MTHRPAAPPPYLRLSPRGPRVCVLLPTFQAGFLSPAIGPLEEEALHFTVTGTLMRQNLKVSRYSFRNAAKTDLDVPIGYGTAAG